MNDCVQLKAALTNVPSKMDETKKSFMFTNKVAINNKSEYRRLSVSGITVL